jgi:hypothetical protein
MNAMGPGCGGKSGSGNNRQRGAGDLLFIAIEPLLNCIVISLLQQPFTRNNTAGEQKFAFYHVN